MAEAMRNEETKTMKTKIKIALASALALLCAAFAAPSASASFGFAPGTVDSSVHDQAGNTYTQAGGHPASIKTEFGLNREVVEEFSVDHGKIDKETQAVGGPLRRVTVEAPPGLIGNPTAIPRCSLAQFMSSAFRPCPD